VSRRLPRSFIGPWDQWLQRGIASSREQLAEDWLDRYLGSPLWRFALAAGVCGSDAWAGVMMPSVDRVGRYFPLCLAAPLEGGAHLRRLFGARQWFASAEALLLATLEDQEDGGFDLDDFDARVEELGIPPGGEALRPEGREASGWWIPIADPDQVDTVLPDLAQALIGERMPMSCLWWSAGSECVAPSLLVSAGLPPAAAYASFLDGQWPARDWQAWGMRDVAPSEPAQ